MAIHEHIPVEDFFRPPTRTEASISPDGTKIAYLAPWRNRLNVWVHGVADDSDARCVTADETRGVLSYQWTDDPRWLLYTRDAGGDENWHIMRTLPHVARPHLANDWHLFVGDPDDPAQEADMLARSPITREDRIHTPLLVIQGANDVRVVQAESDNLGEALRARGVDVEYMVKEDEGHGFVNSDNVIDMFRLVDGFLAEHLGASQREYAA